jgi:hypothetical protein
LWAFGADAGYGISGGSFYSILAPGVSYENNTIKVVNGVKQ